MKVVTVDIVVASRIAVPFFSHSVHALWSDGTDPTPGSKSVV